MDVLGGAVMAAPGIPGPRGLGSCGGFGGLGLTLRAMHAVEVAVMYRVEVAAGTAKLLETLGRGCIRGFGLKIGFFELVVVAATCDVVGNFIGAPTRGRIKLMFDMPNGAAGIAGTTVLVVLGTVLKGRGVKLVGGLFFTTERIPLDIGTLPVLLDFGIGNGLGVNKGSTLLVVAVGRG